MLECGTDSRVAPVVGCSSSGDSATVGALLMLVNGRDAPHLGA
jgi:hypothetical protein